MITQIQRWRRFFLSLRAVAQGQNVNQTKVGPSPSSFRMSVTSTRFDRDIFSYLNDGRDARANLVNREASLLRYISQAHSPPGCWAHSGNRSSVRHKSTYRAHRHVIALTSEPGEKLQKCAECGSSSPSVRVHFADEGRLRGPGAQQRCLKRQKDCAVFHG